MRTDGFALNVPEDFETWFPDRTVTLQASGANLSLATLPVHLHSLTEPVELKLASATPRSGKLLDEAGSPAVGVRVEVVRIGDAVGEPVVGEVQHANLPAWPDAVTSGPDGKFVIPALGGSSNVWVRVLDPRFALDSFSLDGSRPNEPCELRLAPARPMTVVVRAADNNARLVGRALPSSRIALPLIRISAPPITVSMVPARFHRILTPLRIGKARFMSTLRPVIVQKSSFTPQRKAARMSGFVAAWK